MALEATHLRFALDVRDDYHVADLSRYLSGTIYPDSRYVSGIDRLLTHPKDFSDIPLPKEDDFRKGWETHLMYDLLQGEMFAEISGSALVRQGDEAWRERTAYKMILNELDFVSLDVSVLVSHLGVILNPFGESVDLVKKYHDAVAGVFRNEEKGWIRERLPIFEMMKSDAERELLNDLLSRCDRLRNDTDMMGKIAGIYDRTMNLYRKRYRKCL